MSELQGSDQQFQLAGTPAEGGGDAKLADQDQANVRDQPKLSASDAVRASIPLGIAAIVVVFAAIGVQGEVLSRFIRMQPVFVAVSFTLALVGVALPLVLSKAALPFVLRRPSDRWATVAPAVVGGVLVVLTGDVG